MSDLDFKAEGSQDDAGNETDASSLLGEDEEKERLRKDLEDAQRKILELQKELTRQKGTAKPSKPPSQRDSAKSSSSQKNQPEASSTEESKLPVLEIVRKEVGVSYDSSKMRSTLTHIDIEEMCRCLSKAIRKHILHGDEVNRTLSSNQTTDDSIRRSLNSLPNFLEEGEAAEEQAKEILLPKSMENKFNEEFDDPNSVPGKIPEETQIYYYAKNLILKCRMEKECSVICLIYIERLISKTGIYINERNWKKLLFTSLVLSSKVWDDESYENIHFAKVFTLYPLRTINDMERVLLNFIQFDVHITGSEYAKYYFILRTYSETSNRSFPLRPLDVDTIRMLQSKCHRAEDSLRNIHADSLHKTL